MSKLVLITLALFANLARAEMTCYIGASSEKDPNTYDQFLYSGEINPDAPVVIKADRSVLVGPAVQAEMLKIMASSVGEDGKVQLKPGHELDGATMVVGSLQEDGIYTIGLGRFDLSNGQSLFDDRHLGQRLGRESVVLDRPNAPAGYLCRPGESKAPAEPAVTAEAAR